MKTTTVIIIVTLIASSIKAQQFGLSADMGISKLSETFRPFASTVQNKSQLYYGIGLFYEKVPSASKLGLKVSLDFNKRGAKGTYGYEWDDFQYGDVWLEGESVASTYSYTLSLLPTINASKKFQFFLGPHLTYAIKTKTKDVVTYYKTDAKQEVLETFTENGVYTGSSFSDRLSFGIRAGLNFKVIDVLGIGLMYQYSRQVNNQTPFGEVPFYNIFNLSTHIYFNSNN